MALLDEYKKQFQWRSWSRALSYCPILPGQAVLDLGCGPGDLSTEILQRGAQVVGVDNNSSLLAAAQENNPKGQFLNQDLSSLTLPHRLFDGLWSSFTAAYFTDFEKVFANWSQHLTNDAWVCITDIDDLFGHSPLKATSKAIFEDYYKDSILNHRYDFTMGRKIQGILKKYGFNVTSYILDDQEFSFQGPASVEVFEAWRNRFQRLDKLKGFLKGDFDSVQEDFLQCLSSPQHQSQCKVYCCLGRRGSLLNE